jgi:hypothetical protein
MLCVPIAAILTLLASTQVRCHPQQLTDSSNKQGLVFDAVQIVLPNSDENNNQINNEDSVTLEEVLPPLPPPLIYEDALPPSPLPTPLPPQYLSPPPQYPSSSTPYQDQLPQERSVAAISIGWILGLGLLAFAFVNTILLGATLFFTFGLFNWIMGLLSLIAPPVALAVTQAFTAFVAPFAVIAPALAG